MWGMNLKQKLESVSMVDCSYPEGYLKLCVPKYHIQSSVVCA